MNEVLNCRQCPRLVEYLRQIKSEFPNYHNKPVPAYGADNARLLIVGLAPGKHGANATGIPFTGDASGKLLFHMLKQHGFAPEHPSNTEEPEVVLDDCKITNAVKCLPPQNKPSGEEVLRCNRFLSAELSTLNSASVILVLGRLAHNAVLKALNLKQVDYRFQHAAVHHLQQGMMLLDSYHCSRYNLQTGRLTEAMFNDIFHQIRLMLK